MGLDLVGIVMDIEDRFGISIPDEDASRLQTVGESLDYIVRLLQSRRPGTDGGCQSQRAYYRLRRGLMATFRPPRRSIRPDTRLGQLIPVGPARQTWPAFAREQGLPVPPRRFRGPRFPDPETTLRELAPFLVREPFCERGEVNREAVWFQLRQIISGQLGLAAEEIQLHHHYINDLHCD